MPYQMVLFTDKKHFFEGGIQLICCIFFFFFHSNYTSYAQEIEHIENGRHQEVDLKEVLFEIESHFEVSILYESKIIAGLEVRPDFNFAESVHETLNKLFQPFPLKFQEVDENTFVVLSSKPKLAKNKGAIHGKITNINGEALIGVNVVLEGTQTGAATDTEGKFEIINIDPNSYQLLISHIGFLPNKQAVIVRANHFTEVNAFLNEDFLELKNFVVTGSRGHISKIESSIALTTFNPSLLDKIAPRSTADALQLIPGFYVESSGGEVSNNLFSRGMSAEGSFQYVSLLEDGLPIYEAGNLDWASSESFVRIDLSLKKIEALRGGSGSIFASNAPGGIINFISHTGEEYADSEKLNSKIRLQTSDFGQVRTELNIGGKFAKNTFFNLGGFYRRDKGIRRAGFTANNGGQIKANVTRKFPQGYVRMSAKYLNDRNIFYLPIPLQNTPKPSPIPHFNPNYGTMNALRRTMVSFPTPEGPKTYDLTDGFHNDVKYIGSEISFKILKNWTIINKNRLSYLNKETDAIISVFEPVDAAIYAQEKMGTFAEAKSYQYTYINSNEPFNEKWANGNGLVSEQGWWHNALQLKSFTNSFEANRKTKRHTFTAGIYVSDFRANTQRHWANLLLEVKDENAQRLNLDFYDENEEWVGSTTHNGFTTYQAFNIWENNIGKAKMWAVFADEEWKIKHNLNFNIGLRYETLSSSGSLENTQIFDLNSSSSSYQNPVLANIRFGDGTFESYNWNFDNFAASLGANFNLTEDKSFYGRATKGFRMPDFDNWQARQSEGGQTEKVLLLESGYKHSSPKVALFVAGFYTSISNQLTTDASIDTLGNVLPFRTRGSQTIGSELEISSRPFKNFKLDLKATLQQAHYKVKESEELPNLPPIDGNQVKRIPNAFFTLMPTYEYENMKLFGTIQYFGHRFSDETNTADLPAFVSFNLGASWDIPLKSQQEFSFLIHIQNLTNGIGLTEGNPRIIGSRTAPTRMARPILGRSVIASATCSF